MTSETKTSIDFVALAAALLDRAEALVSDWLPGGKKQGKEYVCADLNGGAGGSTSINLLNGKWAEFSDGGERGTDLVSLYAAIHGLGEVEAARELIDRYGWQSTCLVAWVPPTGGQAAESARPAAAAPAGAADASAGKPAAKAPAKRQSVWSPIVPVPPHAPAPTGVHWHRGKPEAMWAYHFNGDFYGCVTRFIASDGGKETLPHTWCEDKGDDRGLSRWHFKQWDEPRPLYVPAGALADGRPVVLVEGEKCADAGHALLGDEFGFVSWPGGCKAWQKAGWAWLQGRKVTAWPDCDSKRELLNKAEKAAGIAEDSKPILPAQLQPGMKAMAGIADLLQAQQACVVAMCAIPAPGAVADGWDIADAIAEGWDAERVRAFILAALPYVSSSPEVRAAVADPEAPAGASGESGSEGELGSGGSAGWRAKLLYAGLSIAKVRENVVLALDGCELGGGKRLAGIPEAADVIAFNEFSNSVVKLKPTPWGTSAGPWLEQDELEMGLWLTRVHFLPSMPRTTLEEAVLMVAQRHTYHPVRNKLDALRGKWDKQRRLRNWLKRFCVGEAVPAGMDAAEVERRDKYLERVGTWMVMAMVARALQPGCKFDNMVIFEGAQGLGKSSMARALGGEWFADTGLSLGEKDSYQNLQGMWVYEIGEMDAFSRAEVTKVKQFISSQKDRFRASFDKRPRDYPRQCIFIGTTNERHYLTDPTGNRRFWPVPVNLQVDVAALKLELDQMFAEALSYFEAGDRFHPNPREQRELFDGEQEQRAVENAIEVAITKYLYDEDQKIGLAGKNGSLIDEVSLSDLLLAIGIGIEKLTPGKFHEKQAAAALRRLGWDERRLSGPGRPRVYCRPSTLRSASPPPAGALAPAAGTHAARATEACPV